MLVMFQTRRRWGGWIVRYKKKVILLTCFTLTKVDQAGRSVHNVSCSSMCHLCYTKHGWMCKKELNVTCAYKPSLQYSHYTILDLKNSAHDGSSFHIRFFCKHLSLSFSYKHTMPGWSTFKILRLMKESALLLLLSRWSVIWAASIGTAHWWIETPASRFQVQRQWVTLHPKKVNDSHYRV